MSHENEVEQLNIAICDDEENIRIYIRKLIQKQETFCKITEFSSGKELLEFQDETNAEEIDILFLDISMEMGMEWLWQSSSEPDGKQERSSVGKPAASDICNGISGIYAGGFFC